MHSKDDFLHIIHDKMVQNYTPKVANGEKNDLWVGQLPISLMGMIAHGHGHERYVKYSNELWLNDPNFTIGSLL